MALPMATTSKTAAVTIFPCQKTMPRPSQQAGRAQAALAGSLTEACPFRH
jgi:hypothetical protein